MYYLIYKTINLKNGKYYIGAHKTHKIDDKYLGSGVALRRSILKYGKENFTKEIIAYCSTKEEMYLLEERFVDHTDDMSYNMRRGGKGGWDHIDSRGDKNPMRNPETQRKVVETARKNNSYHSEERKLHQQKITKLAAEKSLGKKRPEHSLLMIKLSKTHWKNNKEKMRNALSSFFDVVSPDGKVYTTNRLEEFCSEHDLTYNTLWNTSRTHKFVKRGKAKGWKCTIIQK